MENGKWKIVAKNCEIAKTGEIGKNSWDRSNSSRASKKKRKKPNKIKQTPPQKKEAEKNAKQCEKKQENSPQVAIKRQWEIGPEIVRLQMPEMRSSSWWAAELLLEMKGALAGAAERCLPMKLETATP